MTLEDRIKQLEKRCRRLSLAMTCLLVVAGGVIVLAASSQKNEIPGSLQADKLEIVDESGKVHIRLGKLRPGGYGLSVYDKEGDAKRACVSLGYSMVEFPSGVSGRSELKLRNEDASLVAAANPQGATIAVRDSADHLGVHIGVGNKSISRIIVQNKGARPSIPRTTQEGDDFYWNPIKSAVTKRVINRPILKQIHRELT